jgi:hypothetical protein
MQPLRLGAGIPASAGIALSGPPGIPLSTPEHAGIGYRRRARSDMTQSTHDDRSQWHRWFAWYPVIVWIDGERRRVWLRYVQRKLGTKNHRRAEMALSASKQHAIAVGSSDQNMVDLRLILGRRLPQDRCQPDYGTFAASTIPTGPGDDQVPGLLGVALLQPPERLLKLPDPLVSDGNRTCPGHGCPADHRVHPIL